MVFVMDNGKDSCMKICLMMGIMFIMDSGMGLLHKELFIEMNGIN